MHVKMFLGTALCWLLGPLPRWLAILCIYYLPFSSIIWFFVDWMHSIEELVVTHTRWCEYTLSCCSTSSSTPLCWVKQLFPFGWRRGLQRFVCCCVLKFTTKKFKFFYVKSVLHCCISDRNQSFVLI